MTHLLEWSSYSLAYEIIQLTKTNHTTSHGHCTLLCDNPDPVECASFWIRTNTLFTYCCVSNWIFAMRYQSLSFTRSWSQAPWVLAGLKSQEREAEGQEEKTVVKNMQRNPLHNLPENLLITWPVLSFHCPNPCHRALTHWGVAPVRVAQLHPLLLACSWRVGRGNKKWEVIKELRFC